MSNGITQDKAGKKAVDSPVMGKSYWVPCVFAEKWYDQKNVWIPVLGPLHEDAEIIKFPEEHWHIDWRFVSQRLWKKVRVPAGTVISAKFTTLKVEMKRRKCLREEPYYPALGSRRCSGSGRPTWGEELEQKHAAARVKCLRCPHRNLPLDPASVDVNGLVQCRGHGLRWHLRTGKLAPYNSSVIVP